MTSLLQVGGAILRFLSHFFEDAVYMYVIIHLHGEMWKKNVVADR